jgi:hypothetical protein
VSWISPKCYHSTPTAAPTITDQASIEAHRLLRRVSFRLRLRRRIELAYLGRRTKPVHNGARVPPRMHPRYPCRAGFLEDQISSFGSIFKTIDRSDLWHLLAHDYILPRGTHQHAGSSNPGRHRLRRVEVSRQLPLSADIRLLAPQLFVASDQACFFNNVVLYLPCSRFPSSSTTT